MVRLDSNLTLTRNGRKKQTMFRLCYITSIRVSPVRRSYMDIIMYVGPTFDVAGAIPAYVIWVRQYIEISIGSIHWYY